MMTKVATMSGNLKNITAENTGSDIISDTVISQHMHPVTNNRDNFSKSVYFILQFTNLS